MPAVWKGALSFGLVHIPVELHSAVRRKDRLSFRLLHKKDLAPIKNERVCTVDGETVAWDDLVKGYEISKGEFVVVTDADFKKAAVPSTKRIELAGFVKSDEVDPRYFETPYYLIPQKSGEKAYALFAEALRRTDRLGLGTLTLRQRESLVGIRPIGPALLLEMMRFQTELVDPADLSFPDVESEKVKPQELAMAEQLIENLAEAFDPSRFHDTYEEKLRESIRAKAEGKEIEFKAPKAPRGTRVIDLMAKLEESLAQTGKRPAREGATAKKTKRARKKSAA
jgi:DNA end-binding protein Ku